MLGRVGEDGGFEVVDLVIHLAEYREEAVDEGIEDAIEQELLAVERAAGQLRALLIERWERFAMDGHEVAACDEHVHLVQRMGVVFVIARSAVEDEKDVIAVVVQFGTLAEMLGVLEREGVKAEDLAKLGDF